jgi:hypothetical protein
VIRGLPCPKNLATFYESLIQPKSGLTDRLRLEPKRLNREVRERLIVDVNR